MTSDSAAPRNASGVPTAAELEATLRQLEAVSEVSVELNARGDVAKINIIAEGTQLPKAIVRDVEAALHATYRLKIDHRAVSVASRRVSATPAHPLAAPDAITPVPAAPVAPAPAPTVGTEVTRLHRAAPMRPYTIESVEVQYSRTAPRSCRVTLRRGDHEFVGEADATTMQTSVERLAVDATLAALGQMNPRAEAFRVEGVKQFTAFDRVSVLVSILAPSAAGLMVPLSGVAAVADRLEVAAVVAVLDATNRWLAAGAVMVPNDGRM